VVSSFARDRLRMREVSNQDALSQQRLLELLQKDLINAREFQRLPAGKGFILTGFGALNASSLLRCDRPVEIRYEICGNEENAQLVRQQRYLDERIPTPPWREIVSQGVAWLSIESIAVLATPT